MSNVIPTTAIEQNLYDFSFILPSEVQGIFLNPPSKLFNALQFTDTQGLVSFNFGNKLIKNLNVGYYVFGFDLKVGGQNYNIKVNRFVNNVLTDFVETTFTANQQGRVFFDFNILAPNTEVNFTFEVTALEFDVVSFLISNFCITETEQSNPNLNYILPILQTNWASKVDTTNVISLTGSTNNLFSLTTATTGNGSKHLDLFDNLGKITPNDLNDFINVDLSFEINTPAGTDNYIDVIGIVGGVVYRQETHKLLKGSGNKDTFSLSWGMAVEELFLNNGLEIFINPNVALSIEKRYLSVATLHKGK